MQKGFDLVRGGNWWDSKIPPLLAFASLQILLQPVPPLTALGGLFAFLVWAICIAAYAHVLNDLFDLEVDLRAGKPRRLAKLAIWQRVSLIGLLAFGGFLPLMFLSLDLIAAGLAILMYLIPLLYSAPPFRFKERGVIGVLADASLAHVVPSLFVMAVFRNLAETANAPLLGVWFAAGVLALAMGVRGILVHQLEDREQDIKASVKTFVLEIGPERTCRLITRFVFPLELLALGVLALLVYADIPLLFWIIGASLALDVVRFDRLGHVPFDPAPLMPARYLPLTDFYQLWMPLSLAVLMVLRDPVFVVLLAAELLLFRQNLRWRGRWTLFMLATPPLQMYHALKARMVLWRGRTRK